MSLTSNNFWESVSVNDSENRKRTYDEFNVEKQLGQGSYAVVKLARDKKTGQKYAIKTYEKFKLYDAQRRKNVKNEIMILKMLNHRHVVKLICTIDTTSQVIYSLCSLWMCFLNSSFRFILSWNWEDIVPYIATSRPK